MFWTGELIARNAPVRRRVTSERSPLAERAVAAYVGLAIGDALGATVEFMTPKEIRAQYGVHENIAGGGWLRLKAGQVTDDTTMSLALGESILAAGRVDALAAADAFDAWMRAKPVDIGNTVRRNLVSFRSSRQPRSPGFRARCRQRRSNAHPAGRPRLLWPGSGQGHRRQSRPGPRHAQQRTLRCGL
jgi:ADP-ribosyl-[dinitrogen reductase] hydrolase